MSEKIREEVLFAMERVFLATILWVGFVYLLSTATPDHFTAILGMGAGIMGSVVSFFFRINGTKTTAGSGDSNA